MSVLTGSTVHSGQILPCAFLPSPEEAGLCLVFPHIAFAGEVWHESPPRPTLEASHFSQILPCSMAGGTGATTARSSATNSRGWAIAVSCLLCLFRVSGAATWPWYPSTENPRGEASRRGGRLSCKCVQELLRGRRNRGAFLPTGSSF